MPIQKNDFIELTYTGTVVETGEVFDTTDEAVAAKAGISGAHQHFGPQVICVGQGHLLPGLDENLVGAELGAHTWAIPAQKAFGKKNPKLIQLIPISTFKQQQIQPVVGLQLNIDGQVGTVKVASGGRVLVDFNHPLAGKDVSYTVTITRLVTDPAQQLQGLVQLTLHLHQEASITITGKEAAIELPASLPEEVAAQLGSRFAALCKLDKVSFTAPQAGHKHLNKEAKSADE